MLRLGLIEPMLKDNPSDAALLKKKVAVAACFCGEGNPGRVQAGDCGRGSSGESRFRRGDAGLLQAPDRNGAGRSNPAMVLEFASQGGEKFPKEMTFQLLTTQAYLKQGKFQQGLESARRALTIDSKNVSAAQYVLFTLTQLGQTDSIIPAAQKMIAGGIPKDSVAQSLMAVVRPALEKAQVSKERADWEATLTAAETVDAIAPSPQSAFYIGRVAYQLAGDLVTHVQTLTSSTKAADKALACSEAKQSEDLLAKTSIAMPRGAAVDKNVAAQILTNVGALGDFVDLGEEGNLQVVDLRIVSNTARRHTRRAVFVLAQLIPPRPAAAPRGPTGLCPRAVHRDFLNWSSRRPRSPKARRPLRSSRNAAARSGRRRARGARRA